MDILSELLQSDISSFPVFILSLIGLWITIYFTGVYYRWFSSHVVWMPKVCQLEEESCMRVLDTPRAKIFGIPNSVFGIGLYLYLIVDLFAGFPTLITLLLLTAALARSIFLAYSLLFITKIPCLLCFTGQGVNLILFLIVLNRG